MNFRKRIQNRGGARHPFSATDEMVDMAAWICFVRKDPKAPNTSFVHFYSELGPTALLRCQDANYLCFICSKHWKSKNPELSAKKSVDFWGLKYISRFLISISCLFSPILYMNGLGPLSSARVFVFDLVTAMLSLCPTNTAAMPTPIHHPCPVSPCNPSTSLFENLTLPVCLTSRQAFAP